MIEETVLDIRDAGERGIEGMFTPHGLCNPCLMFWLGLLIPPLMWVNATLFFSLWKDDPAYQDRVCCCKLTTYGYLSVIFTIIQVMSVFIGVLVAIF